MISLMKKILLLLVFYLIHVYYKKFLLLAYKSYSNSYYIHTAMYYPM